MLRAKGRICALFPHQGLPQNSGNLEFGCIHGTTLVCAVARAGLRADHGFFEQGHVPRRSDAV